MGPKLQQIRRTAGSPDGVVLALAPIICQEYAIGIASPSLQAQEHRGTGNAHRKPTSPTHNRQPSTANLYGMKIFDRVLNPREIRRRLGLNQEQFWTQIGVTQSGGSRYESGREMPKPVRELLRLVHVEQVDLSQVKRVDSKSSAISSPRIPICIGPFVARSKAGTRSLIPQAPLRARSRWALPNPSTCRCPPTATPVAAIPSDGRARPSNTKPAPAGLFFLRCRNAALRSSALRSAVKSCRSTLLWRSATPAPFNEVSARMSPQPRVIPFDHLRMGNVDEVGGKNASLGEMISQLADAGIRVPGGFCHDRLRLSGVPRAERSRSPHRCTARRTRCRRCRGARTRGHRNPRLDRRCAVIDVARIGDCRRLLNS